MEFDDQKTAKYYKNQEIVDREWFFVLTGTAIGSGILYSPIIAARAGVLVFFLSFISALFVAYFAQKFFSVVLIKANDSPSYNSAVKKYWNGTASVIISIAFALFLIITILIYSKGLDKCFESILLTYGKNYFDLGLIYVISLLLLLIVASFLFLSERFLLKLICWLTFILIASLVVISILLIPFWRFDSIFLDHNIDFNLMLNNFILSFPLFLAAIVFYMVISPMITSFKKRYLKLSDKKLERKILTLNRRVIYTLAFIIGIFIISSSLTLTLKGIDFAFENNASSLMKLLNHGIYYSIQNNVYSLSVMTLDETSTSMLNIITFLNYQIVILAMITSFYGAALGLLEVLINLIPSSFGWSAISKKYIAVILIIFGTCIVTLYDYDMLNLVGFFFNTVTGIFLFIIPILIILTSKRLKEYRKISLFIIFVIGIFTLFSFFIYTLT